MKHEKNIKEALENIFKYLSIKPEMEVSEPEENSYDIRISGDDLNFLIGYRGQSLEALQNILKLILFKKTNEHIYISIDINGYTDNKVSRIQELARKFIDKVRFFEKEIELPKMNPWERRQVHMFVSEYDDVSSESTGEEPNRRIVLKPKKI